MRVLQSPFLSCTKLLNRDLIFRESASKQQFQDVIFHYHEIKKAVLLTDYTIIPPIFKACANLQFVKQGFSVHADVIKMGFDSYTSISNSILSFYIKCSSLDSALSHFDCMVNKDSVSWNAVIHGFLSQGVSEYGLSLFIQARVLDFEPNVSTLVLVLQACWRLKATDEGLNIHGLVIRIGLSAVVSLQNSLLSVYVKSEDLDSAQRLFDEMCERDVISWSVMISGYAQSGEAKTALQLFREMSIGGVVDMDGLAAVSILQACSGVGDINQGRLIHAHLIRRGFEADVFVGNSLVDMYSKCLDVESAYVAFNQMSQTNAVSWNSVISGSVHNERYLEALLLFESMQKTGFEGDGVTLVNLLQSCKRLGQGVWCKSIHSVVIRWLFESNELVMNSLLDAYAKTDLMELALKLFRQMEKRNVISWSTMIAGFTHSDKPEEAISLFQEMQVAQEKPNSVTMLSLLQACSASAEAELSKCAHGVAVRNNLGKDLAVGTALLDMYAKCGDIKTSRKVFHDMAEKNIMSWNAMIGALGVNGLAREALALLNEMESENIRPNEITMLSVLSTCSHGGLVKEGFSSFQRMMRDPFLQPSLEHYSCMVDMLGRAGDLEGAHEVIKRMPGGLEAGASAWGALLSACRSYGNCELGEGAASRVLELEPSNSAGYLLTSSMYAKGGLLGDTARMRLLMKEKGVRVVSGYSLVHVDYKSHKFVAWDWSHPQCQEIYSMVEHLHGCMKREEGNDP